MARIHFGLKKTMMETAGIGAKIEDDDAERVYPIPESLDAKDNDCDDQVDEDFYQYY